MATALPLSGVDTLTPVYRKVTLRLIPFLFICYLFNYIDRVNIGLAKLYMLHDLGMSEQVYGFAAGIFFVGYLAFGVPSNLMLQRLGARRWIGVMMVLWGICSASLALTKTPAMFYTIRFLTGSAEAGFFPGIVLYLTRWFPRAQHGRVMAIFMSAIPISGVVSGPVSGWILGHFASGQGGLHSWQWLFLVQGLPTILLGSLVWLVLSDGIEQAPWLSNPEKRELRQAMEVDEARRSAGAADSFGAVLRNPAIWMLGLLYFCIQSGVYAINFWLPTIIRSSGESDPFIIGLMSAVPYLCAAIFMLFAGRSADRRQERRWHLAVPMMLGAVGLLIAAMAHGPVMSLFGMTLATMGALTGLPMFWPLTNSYLTAAAAAGGLALINSTGGFAGFVSPYLVGWVKDATGATEPALCMLAGLMALGTILILRVPARTANY